MVGPTAIDSVADPSNEWIGAQSAAQLLRDRIAQALRGDNPTPWIPNNGKFNGPYSSDDVESNRLVLRVAAALQAALLNHELSSCLFDGQAYKALPAAAFVNNFVVLNGIMLHGLELDPLWPDEWQPWSGCSWVLSKSQFEAWLASDDAISERGLPPIASEEATNSVAQLEARQPSQRTYVPLSEAVTWIAFGLALDSDRMTRTLSWGTLCDGNLAETVRRMSDAAEKLLDAGADAKIAFKGRLVAHRDENGALTSKIDADALNDFRQFDIYGKDHLRYGRGPRFTPDRARVVSYAHSARAELFTNVTVSRAELLSLFPDPREIRHPLLDPVPASLPDIGPTLRLDEAVCLLATGKPSDDIEIRYNSAGDFAIASPQPPIEQYHHASRALHRALREGDLSSYVAPADAEPLSIPRYYWNTVDPVYLHPVYKGTAPHFRASNNAILLSRRSFDDWLPQVEPFKAPATPRPSHADVVQWCKDWMNASKGGMDKAWNVFRKNPKHVGLSRDDVFRPAWREATRG